MKSVNLLIVVVLTLLIASQAHTKSAEEWAAELGYDPNVSYDASRVMETIEGKFSQKVHQAPGKQMMEMNTGGVQARVIVREDLGKSYTVMQSMGMYQEIDIDQALEQSWQSVDYYNIEKVGNETVNGFSSTKYKTKFEDTNGKGDGFIWITDEGINIKAEMIYASSGIKDQHVKMELTDLNVRSQDPNLFEVPTGLQRMDMGNMSGRMERHQQSQGTATANQDPNSSQDANQNPSIAEDVGQAAVDETRSGMVNETREAIKKGFKGLFK